MELKTTLIGLIILLLTFVPVIYLIVNATGREKKLKKEILQLSQQNGIQLDKIEIIGDCIIAVDGVSKKLVYSSKSNPTNGFKILNINEVQKCRAKSIKQNNKTLDWVGLEFDVNNGSVAIPFYIENSEIEYTKDPFICLQDAKRWEDALRPLLKAS